MRLYHYTCTHSARLIKGQRWLTPNRHPLLPQRPALVWLTDLDVPDKFALGLTSFSLSCDRTEFRAIVVTADAVRWTTYAHRLPRRAREVLESAPGVMPAHWWLAEVPQPVLEINPSVRRGKAVAS